MVTWLALGALLAVSYVSAVVPLGPPEAYVLALTAPGGRRALWIVGVAAAAALGQASGKLTVFLSVRRCRSRGTHRSARLLLPGGPATRWRTLRLRDSRLPALRLRESGLPALRSPATRLPTLRSLATRLPALQPLAAALLRRLALRGERHPHELAFLVGVSAFTGLPPLAVVAPLAATTTMRPRTFALSGFVGRFARFTVLALVPALL